MNKKSRTEYSAVNSSVAITARLFAILMGFAARVVFTHTLNEDYVGINGLFGNILNILSISELGVGTAITYALYKPIAEEDKEKQKSLMLLFKRFYFFVGTFVLLSGLAVIPFLDLLMKNTPQVDHLVFLYILFLTNSVLSYVSIYKRTLIDAHQMNYISVIIQTGSWALASALQMVFLILTRNFVIYLLIMISCTAISNILITIKANRMFPYLKEKNIDKLSDEEKSDIKKNIKAMLFHKVGEVAVNNTDNILISAIVSTTSVGLYSNYYLLIGSVRQVLNQMFQGITASVGNLGVIESEKRIKKVYESSFFMAQWIFGLCSICMFQILDIFVGFSFGENYIFDRNITLILCINFYLLGLRQPTLIFRDSMGLFWYDRYKSVAEAAINLVSSIVLGKLLGVFGIFLGTFISTVTTSIWIEPLVLYKYKLHKSVMPYFGKLISYVLIFASLFYLETYLCDNIGNGGILIGILRALICFAITNIAFLIIYGRTEEFKFLKKKGISLYNSKIKHSSIKSDETIITEDKCEKALIQMTQDYFCSSLNVKLLTEFNEKELDEIVFLARKHCILPLFGEELISIDKMPRETQKCIEKEITGIVSNNYRYLFTARDIIIELETNDIKACVLKGAYAASFYRIPELRKSSDIDILLSDSDKLNETISLLEKKGFTLAEKQIALHHAVMRKAEICVEIHTMLAEPFDNKEINKYIDGCLKGIDNHFVKRDCMDISLPVLDDAYNAYELLLHMLQHFLREGFGLKMLLDWCFFLDREIDEESKNEYLKLVKESKIKGFSDTVTMTCVKKLGLEENKVEWMDIPKDTEYEEFFADIVQAGEFGKKEKNRMVVLRGTGFSDYFREFHHQMNLNYPRAGKVFIIWPILWILTYIRFEKNNRDLRGVSSRELFKNAEERSRLVKNMKLFR